MHQAAASPARRTAALAATALIAAGIALVANDAAADDAPASGQSYKAASAAPAPDKVARGKYIVSTAGCHDCHTPWKMGPAGPAPDMARALSGHPEGLALPAVPTLPEGWVMVASATNTAWAGPWGVSYTANLTPDDDTGLGKWTSRNFRDTIRSGRHQGRGRLILPPMPIAVYNNLTDDDLDAVYLYLQTLPAIRNKVPEPLPPAGAPPAP